MKTSNMASLTLGLCLALSTVVNAALITQIGTPLREHGYQHLQTSVIGSQAKFNAWIQDIESQEYWNNKDTILSMLNSAPYDNFQTSNLLVYTFMESSGGIQIDVDEPTITQNSDGTRSASIVINRDVPEFGSADVAYYALFYIVDGSISQVNFDTRDVLDVVEKIEQDKGVEPDVSIWKKSNVVAGKTEVYQIPAPIKSLDYKSLETKVISTQEEFDTWYTITKKEQFSDDFITVFEQELHNFDFTQTNLVIYRFYEGSAVNTVTEKPQIITDSNAALVTINRQVVSVRTADYYALFHRVNKSILKVFYDKRITVLNEVKASTSGSSPEDERVFEVDVERGEGFGDVNSDNPLSRVEAENTKSVAASHKRWLMASTAFVVAASCGSVIMSLI